MLAMPLLIIHAYYIGETNPTILWDCEYYLTKYIMKLLEKINQFRRDFTGKYQCEFCENIEIRDNCYDDRDFHDYGTPRWECKECGKSTISEGGDIQYIETRYSDYTVV